MCLGILDCVDNPQLDRDVGVLCGDCAKVRIGNLPVRTVFEVQQCYVHAANINLIVQFKVKGYGNGIMNIGELSTRCGVSTQTIRFYEKRGLLAEPDRQPNGYRIYTPTAIDRVAFIQRAQAAGMTLTEVGGVLDLRADGRNPCSHVSQLLTTKLSDVKAQMRELQTLRQELETLIERSRDLDPADCTDSDICHILG